MMNEELTMGVMGGTAEDFGPGGRFDPTRSQQGKANPMGFSFSDLFSGAIDWAKANPGATGALLGGIGSLIDPAQPDVQTRSTKVELPDYIAPYVGRLLNDAESIAGEGYIPYTGARLADFTPDQQAAFQMYRDMDPMSPMQTQGGGIVGQAAQQLLDGSNQRFDASMRDFYMSPYMQGVTDIEKREAQRDFDKALPGINATAAKAGAFGGSRHALIEAEGRRNLSTQLGDIQARGLQSAYTNAQGQFNADQNRMNQGLTAAAGAGNTLAGIGQTGWQNQLAQAQGLLGIGGTQQGLNQKSADIGYQQFLDQRDFPRTQFQFRQNALANLPMTGNNVGSVVNSAPTMSQQLLGSGIGGYNLGNMIGGGKP
jgi:hypothetical protein